MSKFVFGERSMRCLNECDPRLKQVAEHALAKGVIDIAVYCGHRDEVEQNKAYAQGASKLRFPQSKHNKTPSLAFDAAPYPIDWNDIDRFKLMAQTILESAEELGISVRWGGDWNMNGRTDDEKFIDMPHFELI